jgi:hypothetical protein
MGGLKKGWDLPALSCIRIMYGQNLNNRERKDEIISVCTSSLLKMQ